jgi:Tol biopolymer transport system component
MLREVPRRSVRTLLFGLAAAALTSATAAGSAAAATTTIESVPQEPSRFSATGNITPSGRFAAMFSNARLAPNDTDSPISAFGDVYVRDLQTRTNTLVSVSSNGTKGNRDSGQAFVSDSGRYVVFASHATNLVPGDPGFVSQQVYVRDLQTGTTERVSVNDAGERANGFSDAGNISADGRFVVFVSSASNLVPGDTNGASDIFVRDRQTGTTRRATVSSKGRQAEGPLGAVSPVISSDGRYVVFASSSTDLVKKDANGAVQDIFLHDLQTGETELVSLSSAGVQGTSESQSPSVSADGRYVAFSSRSANLVEPDANGSDHDVFVRDRQTGTTERVSVSSDDVQGQNPPGGLFPADSAKPWISPDGRFVSFQSQASNLVPDDTNSSAFNDAFLRDRQAGTTIRVSVSTTGEQGNNTSINSSVSADGHRVLFTSFANNLATADINGTADVFLRDLAVPTP